jgi:hypothetical protein
MHRPGRKNHLSFVLRTKEGVLRKYPIFGGIHAFKLADFRENTPLPTSGCIYLSGYTLVGYVEWRQSWYPGSICGIMGLPFLIVQDSFSSSPFVFEFMTGIKDSRSTSTIAGNL